MPSPIQTSIRLAALVMAASALAGCVTHTVRPVVSRAVIEARAHRNVEQGRNCGALTSPVSVGFAFGEATINELAAPALDNAAQQLACNAQASAVVVGQADGHGAAAEQHALAQSRADVVAQDLRARGVAAERLRTQAEGTAPPGDARLLVVMAEGRRW